MNNNNALFADLQQLSRKLNQLGSLPSGPKIYDYFFKYSNLISPFYLKHYAIIKSRKDKYMQMLAENLYNFVKTCELTPRIDASHVILQIGPKSLSFYMNNPELSPRVENELYGLVNPYVILHLIAEILANAQKRSVHGTQRTR